MTHRLTPARHSWRPESDASAVLRVATYNIHKGVRGVGPGKRLQIHSLADGIRELRADVVLLQEVRLFHHREARRFAHGPNPWPKQGQAEFLTPKGWNAAYRSNAVTRHGEHGNAVLSRWPLGTLAHRDVSDHRFEQRGLLHVPLMWGPTKIHLLVVHLGLMHGSRVRQSALLLDFAADQLPADEPVLVGGDFNDWGEQLDAQWAARGFLRAKVPGGGGPTFPARLPLFSLDRFYFRGLACRLLEVPKGGEWVKRSDHLPLIGEFSLAE